MGNVWLLANGTGSFTLYTLSQEYWPPANLSFFNGTVNNNIAVGTTGICTTGSAGFKGLVSWPATTLSVGLSPCFPVYLKIAPGRTPAGVFLLGVKPKTNQDQVKSVTGTYLGPCCVAWTWLSGRAPADLGTNQKVNQIRIDGINGLVTNQAYTATVLVLYSLTGQSSGS